MKKIFRFRYIFVCCCLALIGYGLFNRVSYYFAKWQFKRDYQAAELGNLAAQNRVGLAYDNGVIVTQDDSKAVYWYRRAAEKGYPNSQHNLALNYEDGRGLEQDYQQAIQWYLKAAEQNFSSSMGRC